MGGLSFPNRQGQRMVGRVTMGKWPRGTRGEEGWENVIDCEVNYYNNNSNNINKNISF